MRWLLLLLMSLLLTGCNVVIGELVTTDADAMRQFKRWCEKQPNTYLVVSETSITNRWRMTCHLNPDDSPVRETRNETSTH